MLTSLVFSIAFHNSPTPHPWVLLNYLLVVNHSRTFAHAVLYALTGFFSHWLPVSWACLPSEREGILILFFYLELYWRIVTLQWRVSFCCTMQGISCMCTCISSLFDIPAPTLFHSSHHSTELSSLCNFSLTIYFTHGSVYVSIPIS